MDEIDSIIETQQQFWRLLRSKKREQAQGSGMTFLQHMVLRFLDESPSATTKYVADLLGLSLSSTSQLIERLARQGLVKRKADAQDRRIIHLSLTSQAHKALEQRHRTKYTLMRRIFGKIPQEERVQFVRIQKELLEALKAEL